MRQNDRRERIGRGAAHFTAFEWVKTSFMDGVEVSIDSDEPKRSYRTVETGQSIDLKTLELTVE